MDTNQPNPPPPPAPPQQINVQTGPAAVADAAGNFLSKISGFSPQQAQTVAALLLTLFICAVLGYLIYSARMSQSETLALIIRSMESESEKNRAANAAEFEKNRAALADSTKMTLQSHQKLSVELGKLEQVVSGLATTINNLQRKIPAPENDAAHFPFRGVSEPCIAPPGYTSRSPDLAAARRGEYHGTDLRPLVLASCPGEEGRRTGSRGEFSRIP